MVTAFHRLAVWPHMRVSDDNAGHEEPLVAALYNNTFQVVCSLSATFSMNPTVTCAMQQACRDVYTAVIWSQLHETNVTAALLQDFACKSVLTECA